MEVTVLQNRCLGFSLTGIFLAELGFALDKIYPVLIVKHKEGNDFAYRVKKDEEDGKPDVVHAQR